MRRTMSRGLVFTLVTAALLVVVQPLSGSVATAAGCWQVVPAARGPYNIDHGADGSLWGALPNGNRFTLARFTGSGWAAAPQLPSGYLSHAVDPSGQPWVVGGDFRIFRLTTAGWQQLPGSAIGLDIGMNGAVWMLDYTTPISLGWALQFWNGSGWTPVGVPPAGANGVAVHPNGQPVIVTSDSKYYRRVGDGWQLISSDGVFPLEMVIGSGTLFGEQLWRIPISNGRPDMGGYIPQRWNGSTWVFMEGRGEFLSIDRDGRPWISNSFRDVFYWTC